MKSKEINTLQEAKVYLESVGFKVEINYEIVEIDSNREVITFKSPERVIGFAVDFRDDVELRVKQFKQNGLKQR